MDEDEDPSTFTIAEGHPESVRARILNEALPTATREGMWSGETALLAQVVSADMMREEQPVGSLAAFTFGDVREFSENELALLKGLADQAAQALTNTRLFDEAQRRLKQVQALREIDMAITASMDLRVTLSVILDQVTSQLGADAAAVLLLNPHTQILEYAAGRGFRSSVIERSQLRLGEGHAGRAALERRTVSTPNLSEVEAPFVRTGLLEAESFQAYHVAPLITKGQVQGVLEIFHREPVDARAGPGQAFDREWLSFLETLGRQAAIAIENASLFDDLQRSNAELALAYDTTLEGWARALELRDLETEGHSRRVTELTVRLARAMGLSEEELAHVRRGALLHDIGKMGIPDRILFKPDPPTDEEWDVIRQHPIHAYEMLSPIRFPRPALDISYCHHEKWDGSGYPRGLKGEQIPLAARIFAIVDVYDALTSDRPYRDAWPEEKAIEYIREKAGQHFDPQVVERFFETLACDAQRELS